MRLESNVAPRILTVSESWITESSNLTEERLDIVFKRCDVPKRMASDLVILINVLRFFYSGHVFT